MSAAVGSMNANATKSVRTDEAVTCASAHKDSPLVPTVIARTSTNASVSPDRFAHRIPSVLIRWDRTAANASRDSATLQDQTAALVLILMNAPKRNACASRIAPTRGDLTSAAVTLATHYPRIKDRAKTLTSVKSTRIVVVSVSVSALTNRVVIRASAPKAIAYLPINEPVKILMNASIRTFAGAERPA